MQGSGCPSPRLTGHRGHSCIKLLIFVSSTSVSDSEETEKNQSLWAATIPQRQAEQPEKQV